MVILGVVAVVFHQRKGDDMALAIEPFIEELEPSYVVISKEKWERMIAIKDDYEHLQRQHNKALKDMQKQNYRIKEYERALSDVCKNQGL